MNTAPTSDGSGRVPLSATHTAYGETNEKGFRQAHAASDGSLGEFSVQRRTDQEKLQNSTMSPGATRAVGSGNRAVVEVPDEFLTCFEEDRNRIERASAFRRLAHKCQVYVAPENDHLRNRLTHAIEVAQFAKDVGSALKLNVDLIEAIALGHDCGHGPGGHASEEAFSPYMESGVYDHAVYGADIVLEPLNLTFETLDGIRSHSWKLQAPRTPEGEVVSWADRIAYVCHDFDDAVRAGIVHQNDLPTAVKVVVGERQHEQLNRFLKLMVESSADNGRIGMEEPGAGALDAFRKFNYERIYLREDSLLQSEKVIALLRGLVDLYSEKPWMLPPDISGKFQHLEPGTKEAIALSVQYVAGMTDRFALRSAVDLLGWNVKDLPRSV